MNCFFKAQFNYCALIWMCYSRENNRKINSLHDKSLRVVYNDKQLLLSKLLTKDGPVSIWERNL